MCTCASMNVVCVLYGRVGESEQNGVSSGRALPVANTLLGEGGGDSTQVVMMSARIAELESQLAVHDSEPEMANAEMMGKVHTATHRNILLDTAAAASRCNTLQHTATHCNTLHDSATHCNPWQHCHARSMQRRWESYTHTYKCVCVCVCVCLCVFACVCVCVCVRVHSYI